MNEPKKDSAALKSKLVQGTRVICRIDKDEWYTGTVSSVSPLKILFDDGSDSEPADAELRYIKLMCKERRSETPLTRFQAEPLWKKHLTSVLYNHAVENEFKSDLKNRSKPWIDLQLGMRSVTTLSPFNELLTLDFRSPVLEYCLGMMSVHTDKLTPKIADSLIRSAAECVERFASACGMIVQHSDDPSRFAISNAKVRQNIRIKLGAFKGGLSYVQVIPV